MFALGIASKIVRSLVIIFALHRCFVAALQSKYCACYYSNWAQYRPELGAFTVANVDAYACTHLIFAFAQIKNNRIAGYEANDDNSPYMWRQFTDKKNNNKGLKTLLAIGGYNHRTDLFSSMAASQSTRSIFIQSVIELLRKWNFDGLDLDWEYPGTDSSADKNNLCLLVKEMMVAFEAEGASRNIPRLLLTGAVPAGIFRLQLGYDLPCLNRYLDFFFVMTYDYHGQWEKQTDFASPMNAPPGDSLSVVSTINYYLQNGASKSKLVLGMALYARTFTLANSGDSARGSPAIAGGTAGTYTRETGVLSYYEVCLRLQEGYTEKYDNLAKVMYAYKDNQWINYENQQTINMKLDYIDSMELAGGMAWALDHDDSSGRFCGLGIYPLLRLISNRLRNSQLPLDGNATTTVVTTTSTTTAATTTTTTTTAPTTTTATTSTPTTTTTPTTPPPPTTTPTTPPPPTTTTSTTVVSTSSSSPPVTGTNNSIYICPEKDGRFPDPKSKNCQKYVFCRMGVSFSVYCQNGKIFRPDDGKCVDSANYSCPYQ